jgi:hypothetical protein
VPVTPFSTSDGMVAVRDDSGKSACICVASPAHALSRAWTGWRVVSVAANSTGQMRQDRRGRVTALGVALQPRANATLVALSRRSVTLLA